MSLGDIKFYQDTLIVETILGDRTLHKNAGFLSSLLSGLKDEVVSHIDENNKVGSVLNLLAPGVITMLFGGKLGLFFGFLSSWFGIDASQILSSLYSYVKEALSKGETLTPAHIDAATNAAVQEHVGPPTQQEAQNYQNQSQQKTDTHTAATLRDAQFLRIALDEYEYNLFRLTKRAQYRGNQSSLFDFFAPRKARAGSMLGSILSWLFKTVLISAGLMVAGDMARKVLNPSDSKPSAAPTPTATQTKFKINPSYQNTAAPQPWEEQVPNNSSSIENMLVGFAKDVYSGLDGQEGAIRSSPNFQAVRDQIAWLNHMATGEPTIYLPAMYANKKAVVDQFIDQVAKNAP